MEYSEAMLRLKAHFIADDARQPEKHTPYLDEAVRMAYEAMEKQIPKKPINPIDEDGYTVFWNCPNCNIQSTDVDVLYCPICGQAIDWSEVE